MKQSGLVFEPALAPFHCSEGSSSCRLRRVGSLRATEHRQYFKSRPASVILTHRLLRVDDVIKRMRGGMRVGVITAGAGGVGKRTAPDDVQRLLVEQWRRAIIKEKVAAKQRRLVSAASPVCHSSLDEITVVTRIGRLRLLRKLGGTK